MKQNVFGFKTLSNLSDPQLPTDSLRCHWREAPAESQSGYLIWQGLGKERFET